MNAYRMQHVGAGFEFDSIVLDCESPATACQIAASWTGHNEITLKPRSVIQPVSIEAAFAIVGLTERRVS